MFERYTEKARRVIFFARYEASQFGSRSIECEHLLLGLLREDKILANRFLRSSTAIEWIRREIESQAATAERVPTSVEIPLSIACKLALAYAAEESGLLKQKDIATQHLLLGILRVEGSVASLTLIERGLVLEKVREEVANPGSQPFLQELSNKVPPHGLARVA